MVAAPNSKSAAQDTEWPFQLERSLAAPAKLVFQAWTESARLTEWWGPKGMQVTVNKLELKPGGTFLYSMTMPTGQALYGKFVYREITPYSKLVFVTSFCDANGTPTRHPMSPTWPLEMLSEIEFIDAGERTTMKMRAKAINATPEEEATFFGARDGMQVGWSGTIEKLTAYLAAAQGAVVNAGAEPPLVGRTLTISREVAAPRELVWKVWTEPAHLTKWFAPRPFTIPVCNLQVRTGGTMEFDMQAPDGSRHHCAGHYEVAEPPRRLVFTAGVPGADGQLMFNNRNTVTFEEAGGKTTIRVHVEVIAAQPAAAPFIDGMTVGWNMTVDQCVEYATAQAAG